MKPANRELCNRLPLPLLLARLALWAGGWAVVVAVIVTVLVTM